ncbi:hypothetical protein GOP47_0024025 [Adiantum capillus-veneris]|uniref:Uncharacterized protein n=1 Tax=Adiantum capillus-veneris TaxID=13818 RepID=A0A9D4U551_ADICA|nr:hypothetical protein GOP47_0024025 [Adiantum capillus-veneris]
MLSSSAVDPLSDKVNTTSSGTSPGDSLKKAIQSAGKNGASSYWGISHKDLHREDGTSWPWHCFKVCLFLSSR